MEASLAGAGTANNQNIFIYIVLGYFVPAYHDALGLCQQNVLIELGVDKRLDILRSAP